MSPMEIMSCPLDVIPIKHPKNRSLEQMVKICNQSLIVTWLLIRLILNMLFSSLPKKDKWKEFGFAPSNHRPNLPYSISKLPYLSEVFPVSGHILLIISTTFRKFQAGFRALHCIRAALLKTKTFFSSLLLLPLLILLVSWLRFTPQTMEFHLMSWTVICYHRHRSQMVQITPCY